jgi:hypothetical protein
MKRKEKTAAEPRSERPAEAQPRETRQLDPCQPERLEAETAEGKPGAAGLGLRSTRSKC